jgi:hypothetical protein
VLRLYGGFGGYSSVGLLTNVSGVVTAYAYGTNSLEDDAGTEALALEREGRQQRSGETVSIRLAFRGFEVKMTKLVLAACEGSVGSGE